MSNRYQFDQNSYQGYSQGHVRAPYNPNYRGARRYPARKKTGCRETQGKNKKTAISGWRKSGRMFMTFVACQNNGENAHMKGGKVIKNKRGEEYTRWTANLVNHTVGTTETIGCLYNHSTGKLYFPDLNLVANPKAPNGGYWGKSSKPKR